jgi:hypothetical protein
MPREPAVYYLSLNLIEKNSLDNKVVLNDYILFCKKFLL